MWEKKDESGGIHDKYNTYTWSGPSLGTTYIMDGTITTTVLSTLNGGGGFAGYTDWRVPDYKELTSILDLQVLNPAVDPTFHQSARCTGCTDVTLAACSCTASSIYWSSTTYACFPDFAWGVLFDAGCVSYDAKAYMCQVRAVRGGL